MPFKLLKLLIYTGKRTCNLSIRNISVRAFAIASYRKIFSQARTKESRSYNPYWVTEINLAKAFFEAMFEMTNKEGMGGLAVEKRGLCWF